MEIIDPRIEEYTERLTTPHDPLLAELSEETARDLGSQQMLTGPVAGRFLELLVWSSQPMRVVDEPSPIAEFNDHVAADPRSVQVILSVRDGMTLIRRA